MDVFVVNMRLLGYTEAISTNSFDVPNIKLFESIMHFLIMKIQPSYKFTWPILSKKEEAPFKREVQEFFKKESFEFEPNCSIIMFILKPCGEKCQKFLLDFSLYTLQKVLESTNLDFERFTPNSSPCSALKYQALAKFHQGQFLSKSGSRHKEKLLWKNYHTESVSSYKKLSNQLLQLSKEKSDALDTEEINSNVAHLEDLWQRLERQLQKLSPHIEACNYILLQPKYEASASEMKPELLNLHLSERTLEILDKPKSAFHCSDSNHKSQLFVREQLDIIQMIKLAEESACKLIESENTQPLPEEVVYKDAENHVSSLDSLIEQLNQLNCSFDKQIDLINAQLAV